MKKNYYNYLTITAMLFLLFQTKLSFGQLTGIKTIPGDFPTIEAAVTALNAQGTDVGGVTFNIAAGHTETLSGKIVMIETGTAANPIVFQKSGVGANPVITSYPGSITTPSAIADGFWVLAGSDYVTIDGIDLQESASNTTTATVMEFGYGLFKASPSNGCQNNVIKNCTITLNRLQNATWTAPGHNGSIGIAVLNSLYTATGVVTVTAATGSNSFNQFYSNTIQNCNAGIVFVGHAAASPFTLGDTNNDVGGNSISTGNTILNYGGAVGAANPATGIFVASQWDLNVSYNTINNNNGSGVNHVNTLRGIFFNAASTSASLNCNFNNITLASGATTSDLTFIENAIGNTAAGNIVNINNNTLTGSYPTATTSALRGIYNNNATPATLNIQNNNISNLSYSTAANAGSGTVYLIQTAGSNAAMTMNITGNTISNVSRTGTTGGTTIGIYVSSGVTGMAINVNNNTVQNMSIDGAGTASIMYGIQTPTGTITVNNNVVEGLTCIKTTGTSALYGIYNVSSPVNENYNNNTIRNLTHNGTGLLYGLSANTTAGTRTVSGNLIHNITAAGTTVAGINMQLSSPNIFKNKIYSISSTATAAPIVSGIVLASLSTNGTANIYNNIIGNLTAPVATSSSNTSPSIRGINITATSTTTNINVAHNTVYLNASSTGASFGTAGLFANTSTTATTSNLILNNNIIVNLSTPSGTYNSVAYQRSSATLTNYSLTSNNNLFYAGTPSAQNLIFFDGTNSSQTLADFKCLVAARESGSVTENPTFLSTVGSNTNFLHINPATPTQIESGSIAIAGISEDFDGNIRQGNGGYTGTGTAPDLGADENDFIPSDQVGPSISYTVLPNTICFTGTTLSATITDVSGVNSSAGTKPRLWFKKASENNILAATNTSADNGWKYVEASNSSSPYTFTIDFALLNSPAAFGDVIEYFVVAQDMAGTPNVSANSANYNTCGFATSVSLASSLFPVTNPRSFTIITPPNPIQPTVSRPTLCFSGDVTLNLGANLGAEYQWQSSPAGMNTWSAISGATNTTYAANGVNASTDYRCIITCNSVPVVGVSPSALVNVTVDIPQVLSTNNGYACSSVPISVLLSATKNTGAVLNWYDSPASTTPLATGDTFYTPLISTTTPYYVAASKGASTATVGAPSTAIGTISSSTIAIGVQRMYFNVLADATIVSVDIYPTAAIGSNGSITIRNSSQVVIADVPYTTTVTGGAMQKIPLNVFLPAGTAYEMGQGTAIGLNRNTTGATYPYTSPSVSITGNSFDVNYYYFFYNWQVATGCESARIPVTATITSSVATSTDTKSACGSYTWIDGNTYTTSNSTATHTLVGAAVGGCDSIITLNLTINTPATSTDAHTACNSYTWLDGNTYTASNSTATYTITGGAANGCDSIVTLNLTINSPTTGTDTRTACNSFTWIDGNTYTSSNSSATHTLTGSNGCDSVVTLNLTVNTATTGTDVQTTCGAFTWIDGNTYTSSNSSATHTLTGSNGCDSVVTLNLTVNTATTGTDVQTTCGAFTWIDGNTYTSSNSSATHTLTGSNGCDSVVTLNLTINTVDTTLTLAGTTLTANTSTATYQWVDCNNGNAPISGETNQSFTPLISGDYAVEITENGCTSMSSCYNVLVIGVQSIANENKFLVYPNPASSTITIEMSEMGTVELFNTTGQLIWSQANQTKQLTKDITELPSGVYNIRFVYEGGTAVKAFVVKR